MLLRCVLLPTRCALQFLLVACLTFGLCTGSAAQLPGQSAEASVSNSPQVAKLNALLEEAWEFRMQQSPLFATSCGDHRFDAQLDEVGLKASEKTKEAYTKYLVRAQEIDASTLPVESQLDLAVFLQDLQNTLSEHQFQSHLIPITNREGFHTEFPYLARNLPLLTKADYENFIARLRGFSRYTEGHIELMREGIRQGVVLPDVSVNGMDKVLAPFVHNDAKSSMLYEPFRAIAVPLSDAEKQELQTQAEEAIRSSVIPGYQMFAKFIAEEYAPKTRTTLGASALPEGRNFYRYRVRRFTTLDTTPEEVHAMGLSEVRRIDEEMVALVKASGFSGDVARYREYLRTSPKFYAPSEESLMLTTCGILKEVDGDLPRLFKTLPRTPYGLKKIPSYIAPKTTSAYYYPASGDGLRAGFYFLNTYDLKSRPLYQLEALSLHEAVPGHHLQIALQQELPLRPHRRFSEVTAFVEGWGLYAERLGLEIGRYQTPESNFGRLSFESWRACRLVVDTGIHYLGWTRRQAIDFLLEHTALSELDATSEVDRYIAWPGQALAYKTGELHIRKLRKQAEDALGERFNVRDFHDVVLRNGAIPLPMLTQQVELYIDATKRQ